MIMLSEFMTEHGVLMGVVAVGLATCGYGGQLT
jgi:Flp pilus assembly pilin Flp